MPRIQDCLSLGKRPYIPAEGTVFLPDFPETPGVMDDGLHLSPGTDHPFRCKDTLHVPIPVSSHLIIVKPVKTLPEDFPFLYHHVPVQAALHYLHHQIFKLFPVVMEGNSPFLVVVFYHFFIAQTPFTSYHPAVLSLITVCRFWSCHILSIIIDPAADLNYRNINFCTVKRPPSGSFLCFPARRLFESSLS